MTALGSAGGAAAKGTTGGVMGAVLAGGRSRRFGGPKALFPVGGRPMAEWALLALEPHTSMQVAVTGDSHVARALGISGRPDGTPGLGPLGGLLTALEWAAELGVERIFLLACDLPLVGPELVGRVLTDWPPGLPASIPRSNGPLGFEPLCAGYSVEALPPTERVVRSGDRSMERLLDEMGVAPFSVDDHWTEEELAVAFTNVNTRDEARRAEDLLRRLESREGGGRNDP